MLVAAWKPTGYDTIYLSVYSGDTSQITSGREVVQFNRNNAKMHCSCPVKFHKCQHKQLALWYFFQTEPELLKNDTDDKSEDDAQDEDCEVRIPPANTMNRLQYYAAKAYPADVKPPQEKAIHRIEPVESACPQCQSPSNLHLVTEKAKIFGMRWVQDGVNVYKRVCQSCTFEWQYQEWQDGLHNYDNHTFLTFELCHHFRSSIQSHVAVGRATTILRRNNDVPYPEDIYQIYLHFEALTNHSYDFNCILCGCRPPVLIIDGHWKAAFDYDVEKVPVPFAPDESIDMDKWWSDVKKKILLCKYLEDPREYNLEPSYQWAPYVNPNSIKDGQVYNTEYAKCSRSVASDEDDESDEELTEEYLSHLVKHGSAGQMKRVATRFNLSSEGSKNIVAARIKDKMKEITKFNKHFLQIYGRSGGVVLACCPHRVTYAVKMPIRRESARDYYDVIKSFDHQPTAVISDISSMLAKHGNKRDKGAFAPYEGRIVEPTLQNIEKAKAKELMVDIPELNTEADSRAPEGKERPKLSLADTFHFKNLKNPVDALRNPKLIQQLQETNTQAAEQLFQDWKKDAYWLNPQKPLHYVFVCRLLAHLQNETMNQLNLQHVKKSAGSGYSTFVNKGRVVAKRTTNTPNINSQTDITGNSQTDQTTVTDLGDALIGLSDEEQEDTIDLLSDSLPKSQELPQDTSSDLSSCGLVELQSDNANVNAGRSQELSGPYGSTCPLINTGVICWFNSSVQAMNHCLLQSILQPQVTCQWFTDLQKLLLSMATHDRAIDPTEIVALFCKENDLDIKKQQDAMDLLRATLRILEDESNISLALCAWETKCFGPVCSTEPITEPAAENISVFPIYLSDGSIQQCVENYIMKPHEFDSPEQFCHKCSTMQQKEQYFTLISLPRIFIVQLQRYSKDSKGRARKNTQNIYLNRQFRLSTNADPQDQSTSVYNLRAVVCHRGDSLDHGHYYTMLYDGKQLCRLSDDDVSVVPEGDLDSNSVKQESYIVFYEEAPEELQADMAKQKKQTSSSSSDEADVPRKPKSNTLRGTAMWMKLREEEDRKRKSYGPDFITEKHCVCRGKKDNRQYWKCALCKCLMHPFCIGKAGDAEPETFVCYNCKVKGKYTMKHEVDPKIEENYLKSADDEDGDEPYVFRPTGKYRQKKNTKILQREVLKEMVLDIMDNERKPIFISRHKITEEITYLYGFIKRTTKQNLSLFLHGPYFNPKALGYIEFLVENACKIELKDTSRYFVRTTLTWRVPEYANKIQGGLHFVYKVYIPYVMDKLSLKALK